MDSIQRLIKVANYFQIKLAKEDHKVTDDQILKAIQLGMQIAESHTPIKDISSRYPEIPDQDPESDARKICPKVKERVGLAIQQLSNSLAEYFNENPVNPKEEMNEGASEEESMLLATASSLPDQVIEMISSSIKNIFSGAASLSLSTTTCQQVAVSLSNIIKENPELQNDSDFLDACCYTLPFVLSGFIAANIFHS